MNSRYESLAKQFSRLQNAGYSEDDIMRILGADNMEFLKNTGAGLGNASTLGGAGAGAGASKAKVKAKPKGKFFKEGGAFDKSSGTLSNLFGNLTNPQFDYNWTPVKGANGKNSVGVQGWGKNIGGMYNIGNTAIQGMKFLKGAQGVSDTRDSIEDRMSDAVLSAGNSPTIWYDLNADQRDLLRKLQRDDYGNTSDISDVDLLGVLGDAGMGMLSGIPGGLPGVIIGGIGGAANSVMGDLQGAADRDAAELEALYQAILESEQYHNQMRKQRAYAGLY